MGLDMYLTKEHYVKNWKFMKKKDLHKITVKLGGKIRKDIKPDRISGIEEQVMYWRKANAIHKWFVDNCGDGEDNCQRMYVSREKLEGLLKTVQEQLRNKIEDILPTQEGFFFGSTDKDAFYWDDLRETEKALKKLLAEPEGGDFYYRASW